MRLEALRVENYPPIKKVDVEGLSGIIVVAGPNGVGKTRLIQAILEGLTNPGSQHRRLVARATSDAEREAWGQDRLDTSVAAEADTLRRHLQQNRRRGKWQSSAFHIDSQRQVTQVQPWQWTWASADPSEEQIGWNYLWQPLGSRYQETIHSIYRMLAFHRKSIATKALELQRAGQTTTTLDFADPLEKFKKAFALLLAPKQLTEISLENPQLRYAIGGETLDINALSSGEREVFAIVVDLLRHEPEDCIIFIDEPELHLHPELSFRLLKTLETIGACNQFVFCTHSADIISASMEHSIVFISPQQGRDNQGIVVTAADEHVAALKELGHSLGVISLGRKIVLIEGHERSLDRDTYGAITQGMFPDLTLAPSGSRQTSLSFAKVVEDVLDKTLWGIEFYMLADRDTSLPEKQLQHLESRSGGRLRFLPRLHVENYFLDGPTIAEAFRDLVPPNAWLRDPTAVDERLRQCAREIIPIAVNMWLSTQVRSLVGEIDIALKDVDGKSPENLVGMLPRRLSEERNRIAQHLDPVMVEGELRARWAALDRSLDGDGQEWRRLFPGKIIVGRLCGDARIQKGYFTSLYIAAARRAGLEPFAEIVALFRQWAGLASPRVAQNTE